MGVARALPFAFCTLLAAQDYWPQKTWRTATPESQGLDSGALAAVVDQVIQKHLGVHSLLVIRHGYAVLDVNFYPYDGRTVHDLASVTKTLTSVLTGIAVEKQVVQLDRPALAYFQDEAQSEQKRKITIRNLLQMESGLDCGYAPGEQELEQMKRSPNWVRFAFSLPAKYDPGTHAAYCSPGYHLLGAAIAAAAHTTELDFARRNLFEPLSIRDVVWADDPQGRSHGWGDSHFYPSDVAKLGYLYLHQGRWRGKQIVSSDWVAMSVAPPTVERAAHGGMGYEWNASKGEHGLQFGGSGRGGQTLTVWPDLDLIVVSTAGGNDGRIAQLIPGAMKGSQPLPDNAKARAQLDTRVALASRAPSPLTTTPLPAMAAQISGVVYEFPVNSSRLDSIALTFSGAAEAQARIRYLGQDLTFPVGLDGVYRLGPYGPKHLPAGASGAWTEENEFHLDLNFIANINHYDLRLRFEAKRVTVQATEASGLIRNGTLVGAAR